ncbi:MAG: phosphate ABC transporter permease PstA [Pseudomonadota bacterium]
MNKPLSTTVAADASGKKTIDIVKAGLTRRYRAERRFRRLGISAIGLSIAFLLILFTGIFLKGYTAFFQTYIKMDVTFGSDDINALDIPGSNFPALVKKSLRAMFPEASGRNTLRELYSLVSSDAGFQLQRMAMADPSIIGKTRSVWVLADDDVDMLMKGHLDRSLSEDQRRLSDLQLGWIDRLIGEQKIEKRFNAVFFTAGDSREPEMAGILGAALGSFYTLLVTLVLSFPIGVAAAIYMEEFAPTNRWTDLIEVNINNLAAVPSIVFGLLGLAVFLNFFGLPRSAPLVGGLVLTLMTLPTIIIASRASLQSVPPSIREAALGIGASKMQTVIHHVLPLALPGMLTGTIIGMARALGESAPLLMIGMVAFIVDPPTGFTDPSTVLPVQIYLWADSPERAFVERTSAATLVLLAFLIAMNGTAVVLRRKFEKRW